MYAYVSPGYICVYLFFQRMSEEAVQMFALCLIHLREMFGNQFLKSFQSNGLHLRPARSETTLVVVVRQHTTIKISVAHNKTD